MKRYKLQPYRAQSTINYEEALNPQQLKVVKEAEGPTLVLAGAGSGKTRVLIYRLAWLLENNIAPNNIFIATFTNRAAHEMIHRSEMLLKSSLKNLWAGTFHHIGNITLRKEAHLLGYSPNFTIVDSADAYDLINDCIEDLGLYKKEKMFPKKNLIYSIYSLSANTLLTIDKTIETFHPHVEEYTEELKKILRHYKLKKKQANIMDFSDLLSQWLKLLDDKETCEKYSSLFKYIMVDEYQDTNKLQFEIIQRLSAVHNNILVVGDDAQSIYSFRAADINNILDFPKKFEGTKIFKLETNYRSKPAILTLANDIISHNLNQFPKTLEPVRTGGETPFVVKTKDVYQQAQFIGQRIIELTNEGLPLKEIAVLFRSRFQALELEMEMLKRGIPYIVRGGVRFFEQAHIKDVLSYLKIILNRKDELSFKRAVCLHKSIGRSYAYKIWSAFSKGDDSAAIAKSLPKRQKNGFNEFAALFEKINQIKSPSQALGAILEIYKDYCYLSFDNPDERIQDLEELTKMAESYPSVRAFLLDMGGYEDFKGETRLSPADRQEALVLSTIHQAKGLEWEAVFLIGFSDYDFPHPKALGSQESLEEERRLFYVATTRAKSLLHISHPQIKYTYRSGAILTRPSQFIYELKPDNYEEMILDESL
jgi:DNA helicase II / ATP-dependent DNA helicase PcrA